MNIEICYPNYVRKAITFSIDDGNIPNDTKFLNIVKPYGIKGTFNLCSHNLGQLPRKEDYVSFYQGYEIANHCKYHPFALKDTENYTFTDAPFDEATADPKLVYRKEGEGNQYWVYTGIGWKMTVDSETYLMFDEQSRCELEELFGKGTVNSFVWPFGRQENEAVFEGLCKRGYYGLRRTGDTYDLDGFAIPRDRMNWSYNANNELLLEIARLYEAYPDDGTLKFFCFGVHSIDFERSGNWHELEAFAKTYGNRPDTYWYASVGEIFAYEDATKALIIGANTVENPSDITVYVKINGKEAVLAPNSYITI